MTTSPTRRSPGARPVAAAASASALRAAGAGATSAGAGVVLAFGGADERVGRHVHGIVLPVDGGWLGR